MGKPSDFNDFEEFLIEDTEDIKIYIAKDVLKNYVRKNILIFVIEGYGRFEMEILP